MGFKADDDFVARHQWACRTTLLLCFKGVHDLTHIQNPAGLAKW